MSVIGIDHIQLAAPKGSEDPLGMEEIPIPANLAKRGGAWVKCEPQEPFSPAILVDDLNMIRKR
ncbi:hypothetical protein [Bacillus changyiensis]|uniref:hypothetical protein n=1 Tax=Bacillus changyiensis TaxID=3004103 RepID=UPI0039778786